MNGLTRPISQLDKLNTLVITVDCLRPDFLRSYNNSNKKVSPKIDSLASSGHLFENAFANASQTAISFPSLFTANYPLSYGGPDYLSSKCVFISEWLKNRAIKQLDS
jgi:arylsulfatase A-like enzyme